jgi:tyrosinase
MRKPYRRSVISRAIFRKFLSTNWKKTHYLNQPSRYWDWSLDWRDIANSSIWSADHGFGGNGDPGGPVTVGEGRCLTDGPFKDLKPLYFNHTQNQHCLSRGFRDSDNFGTISGYDFRPEAIGHLLSQPTYEYFVDRIERDVHNFIHNGIGGDFKALTGSNGK